MIRRSRERSVLNPMEDWNMRTLVTRIMIVGLVALAVAVAGSPPAFASSDFSMGTTRTQDPLNRRDTGLATCRLYIGPLDEVPAGHFLLEINDVHTEATDDRMEIRGTTRVQDGFIILIFDDASVEEFYQQVLRTKIHRPASEVNLQRQVITIVEESVGDSQFLTCSVDMAGVVIGSADARGRVIYQFEGPGTKLVGTAAPQSGATEAPGAVSCSSSSGYTPPDEHGKARCDTPDCLLEFKDYKWWTHYHNNPYEYEQRTIFAPRNVTVDSEGLHLFVREVDVDGNGVKKWSGSEAVVALNLDGSRANLGFGTYLVAARVKTSSGWDTLDTNVAFGAFTYQPDVDKIANPHRELDLAEISRWGAPDQCTLPAKLCQGNAQFALQQWDKGGSTVPNVDRYSIGAGVKEVTLVMIWTGAGKPVTFRQYNGLFTLATLPGQATHEWITPASRGPYIPDSNCQQFHLNMWLGNYSSEKNGLHPLPATTQEVVVTNFEYKAQ